jgi:7-cyano-7-deazaguanine reductase
MGLDASPLGRKVAYPETHDPLLLYRVPRNLNRSKLGIVNSQLPFHGIDLWNAYEITWLNLKGKPVMAFGQFIFPADSEYLIESKSLKLYLHSYSQMQMKDADEVQKQIIEDLNCIYEKDVAVKITPMQQLPISQTLYVQPAEFLCLDDLDIETNDYQVSPQHLKIISETKLSEKLCSHFLKSNCLITQQPDWGSVFISYEGKAIDHAGLLKYIISYRQHDEFHEHCVERIYMDIMQYCQPDKLLVEANYTRRGGIDINPRRANYACGINDFRLLRQ